MYQIGQISSFTMSSLAINGFAQYATVGLGLANNSTPAVLIEVAKKPIVALFETWDYIANGETTLQKIWRGVKVTSTLSTSAISLFSYNIQGNLAIAPAIVILINHMDEIRQADKARRVAMLAYYLNSTTQWGERTARFMLANPNCLRGGDTALASIKLIDGVMDLGIESLHISDDYYQKILASEQAFRAFEPFLMIADLVDPKSLILKSENIRHHMHAQLLDLIQKHEAITVKQRFVPITLNNRLTTSSVAVKVETLNYKQSIFDVHVKTANDCYFTEINMESPVMLTLPQFLMTYKSEIASIVVITTGVLIFLKKRTPFFQFLNSIRNKKQKFVERLNANFFTKRLYLTTSSVVRGTILYVIKT